MEPDEVAKEAGVETHEDRARICEALRRALEESDKTWRVFIDTDGDRRPNALTRLGYLLADYCVVPIQADVSDFERVEQMFELLARYRQNGEAKCQVQLVLWNRMSAYRANACEIGHFTPPKVA